MTIRIVCKHCGSKIDAKDELRGQTRRCPKCKNPILVEPEPSSVPQAVDPVSDAPLKIKRLRPDNFYVILGSDREIAYWKSSEGWLVNVGNGFEAVKRAPDRLPDIGTFVLAEGYVAQTDAGRRLKGIRFSKISGRGALKALAYGEPSDILNKATEPIAPSGAHKRFLLQHIRKNYFYEFTDDAPEIIEFLTGVDSHSHEVGTFLDS